MSGRRSTRKPVPTYTPCRYCGAPIWSEALHAAVCPVACPDATPGEIAAVQNLEQHLQRLAGLADDLPGDGLR